MRPDQPPNSSCDSDDPRDLAAAWFAYLQSGEATQAQRRRFERWRSAHPEHERQYRNVQQIWQATLQLPESELRGILARREAPAGAPSAARRRLGLGLAGACCAAAAGGVGWYFLGEESRQYTARLASARGEHRQEKLPDGSVLDLNTGTRALVRYYAGRRVVELQEGEIFFSVHHDAQRPFLVEAGDARIVVTGTRFNVRFGAEAVHVSVESGSVNVSAGPWWRERTRSLAKGQGMWVSGRDGVGDAVAEDLNAVLAWKRGKIVFEDTPLQQAIAEINRYLPQPARLDAPALRDHRVAGILSIDDPQALIDMLPEFAPVRVYRLPDGRARIVAR